MDYRESNILGKNDFFNDAENFVAGCETIIESEQIYLKILNMEIKESAFFLSTNIN